MIDLECFGKKWRGQRPSNLGEGAQAPKPTILCYSQFHGYSQKSDPISIRLPSGSAIIDERIFQGSFLGL